MTQWPGDTGAKRAAEASIREAESAHAVRIRWGCKDAEGELQKILKQKFEKVANMKPPASRSDSSEKFVVATGFRGARPEE